MAKKKISEVAAIRRAAPTLNRLRRSGEFCCIKISSDYHYYWDVSLVLADRGDHKKPATVGGFEDLRNALLACEKKAKGTK